MNASKRIARAHTIATAYEDAGFLFNHTPTQALKQMAKWAGITIDEARAFARMVEKLPVKK